MKRPLSELRIRVLPLTDLDAQVLLGDLIEDTAKGKIPPSRAFKLAYKATKRLAYAKALRWLAVISRDYGRKEALELI